MSQSQTFQGVGRLHRGHRTLGCVGYSLQLLNGPHPVVRFDPMPDAAQGDIFHLTLEDGRILECQVLTEHAGYCTVLDGPRPERRRHRPPPPSARAFL
jgi:hypothetical protein